MAQIAKNLETLGGQSQDQAKQQKCIRVWCDGCYDMTHFGHANSLRQAKALGDYLIVGVHSDEEIMQKKAKPVFTHDERCEMLRANKWVDEVVPFAPFTTVPETLDKHNCDFTAHGDDNSTDENGLDTYKQVKDVQRYKEYARTFGVSTTDLINRILKATRQPNECTIRDSAGISPYTGSSQFLPTTKKLHEFSNQKEPSVGSKVVYAAGAFDILNPGHLAFLKAAKAEGDFLIVGIHGDEVVEKYKGSIYPVTNLHERVLAVLACRYVDEVVIGAPYIVTKELIQHFNIQLVTHGKLPVQLVPNLLQDPYEEAKALGIYKEIDSGSSLTTEDIVNRVVNNRAVFEARNAKKEEKERKLVEKIKAEKLILSQADSEGQVKGQSQVEGQAEGQSEKSEGQLKLESKKPEAKSFELLKQSEGHLEL